MVRNKFKKYIQALIPEAVLSWEMAELSRNPSHT